MDGGGVGALVTGVVAVGVLARLVLRVDRYDRARARRARPARLVARSPLLAQPRERRPTPAPQDARPPLVEVPDRLLVRAARLVAGGQYADAGLLERGMPVIPAMGVRLMAALEGRGIVGPQDGAGRARVLVSPGDLPELFEHWGIAADEPPR